MLNRFLFTFHDANKLQEVMQHQVKELLDFDHDSDSDSGSDNSPIIKRDSPVVKKRERKSVAFIRGIFEFVKIISLIINVGLMHFLCFREIQG